MGRLQRFLSCVQMLTEQRRLLRLLYQAQKVSTVPDQCSKISIT